MNIELEVSPHFMDYILDWNYEKYLTIGGYGSGKSVANAMKLVLLLLQEKRKALVVRNVYGTLYDSCFVLIMKILDDMDMLADESNPNDRKTKVIKRESPMRFKFPNGSEMIFKGMDKPEKVKSIEGVSVIWIEECSEIKYDAYHELLGRLRVPPGTSMHYILGCNPVSRNNWVYNHFFVRVDDETGEEHVILDEDDFYEQREVAINNTYYHHSIPDDNPWLQQSYIDRLDELEEYDKALYRVARFGRFGVTGLRVLPQFEVAKNSKEFTSTVRKIPQNLHFVGFDFGFEESYNAVVWMAVDEEKQILYIYDEEYINHVHDDKMAKRDKMLRYKHKQEYWRKQKININPIVADNEDPKAISFYRSVGYYIRGCRNKFAGSRLSNTRKIKRFKKIICSPRCKNTIKELKDLTYKKDAQGNIVHDQFNIDPHTFSAMWYGLDTYNVEDLKDIKRNTEDGRLKKRPIWEAKKIG